MRIIDEQPLPVDVDHLLEVLTTVIEAEGYPENTDVCVTLITDEEMERHHLEAMGLGGPTDVLAFPIEMLLPGQPPSAEPGGPPLLLGDVLIAPAFIQAQAAEYSTSFVAELSLMVVHGVLHLMGYDHQTDEDAEVMEGRERAILAEFGLSRR
jgi:probable rRNA maturation factor